MYPFYIALIFFMCTIYFTTPKQTERDLFYIITSVIQWWTLFEKFSFLCEHSCFFVSTLTDCYVKFTFFYSTFSNIFEYHRGFVCAHLFFYSWKSSNPKFIFFFMFTNKFNLFPYHFAHFLVSHTCMFIQWTLKKFKWDLSARQMMEKCTSMRRVFKIPILTI